MRYDIWGALFKPAAPISLVRDNYYHTETAVQDKSWIVEQLQQLVANNKLQPLLTKNFCNSINHLKMPSTPCNGWKIYD